MKKNNKHEDAFKKAKKSSQNGLNISYDKKELEEYLPHLIDEISDKKKILRMDLVNFEIEEKEDEMDQINRSSILKELINPGVIDFIRRCVTKDEAIEILEYCLKKKELGLKEYEKYKNQIMQKGGLKKLIEESGGLKHPGYYEKKYYKKDFNHQKFKSNEF